MCIYIRIFAMQNWKVFYIHSKYLCFLLILQEWESAINANKCARSNTQKGIGEKVSTCVFSFIFFLLNSNVHSMCLFMCNIYCYARCLHSLSILICFSTNQQFFFSSLWFLCIILNFIKSYFLVFMNSLSTWHFSFFFPVFFFLYDDAAGIFASHHLI